MQSSLLDDMDVSIINDELYTMVCQDDPSNKLDAHLKSLSDVDEILKSLYTVGYQQVNLLILAALHGHDAVVRILLSHSSDAKNLVELAGCVCGADGNLVSPANALWCACDHGHYTVARTLIDVGQANVHQGPYNPLLIDAIICNRLDTIHFLIENDYVNIDRTRQSDHPKYNSLMLAASHGYTKIVMYLVEKDAKINQTTRKSHETALGCAAKEGHLDVVRLLCLAGASTNMKNHNEETPLRLAFNNKHSHVVDYLLDISDNELSIEDLELLACSLFAPARNINDNQTVVERLIRLMRRIFQMRKENNFPKSILKPIVAYNYQQECQTIEEFEQIVQDNDRLYTEILLMRERILIPTKNKTLCDALLSRGEQFVRQSNFESCLYLWEHTFHLYQNMGHETSLHRFVWIFCKMILNNVSIPTEIFVRICRLTFEPSEQNSKGHSLKNALCFVTIAAKVLEQPMLSKQQRHSIYQWINDLCHQQRTTNQRQTLLHLCVNEQTYQDINYRAHEIRPVLNFPNLAATQLILTCGNHWINVDAVDISNGNTALHIVSQSDKTDALAIVELLINAGAHIDSLNKYNKTPFDCAKTIEIQSILQKHQKPSLLKCLCARHIVTQQLNYKSIWPVGTQMNTFIHMHGCISNENHID